MKFSKQLSAQADLRYLNEYISYKDLKKAIKVITGSDVQVCTVQDVVSNFRQTNALTGSIFRPPESRFQELLNHELDKINSFSKREVEAILDQLAVALVIMWRLHAALTLLRLAPDSPGYAEAQALLKRLEQREQEIRNALVVYPQKRGRATEQDKAGSPSSNPRCRGVSDEPSSSSEERELGAEGDDFSSAGGKTSSRGEGDAKRRQGHEDGGEGEQDDAKRSVAEALILLEKDVLEVEGVLEAQSQEIVFLDSFVRLNFTGFRKITKKYDKHNQSSAASWYMSRVVRQDFMNLNFTLLLTRLARCYVALRSLRRRLGEQQQQSLSISPADDPSKAASVKEDRSTVGSFSQSLGPEGARLSTYKRTGGSDEGEQRREPRFSLAARSRGSRDCREDIKVTKYLIAPDELMKVKVLILKHLPLLAAGGIPMDDSVLCPFENSSQAVAAEDFSAALEAAASLLRTSGTASDKREARQSLGGSRVPTWEVYLDNEEFTYYTNTRTRRDSPDSCRGVAPSRRVVRVRWQGLPSLNSAGRQVALELSRPDSSIADPQEDITTPLASNAPDVASSAFTVILRQKQLLQLLHGLITPSKLLDQLMDEMEASAAGVATGEGANATAASHRTGARGAANRGEGSGGGGGNRGSDDRAVALTKQKRKADMLQVLQTVWDAVQQRGVSPSVRTWFYRTEFMSEDGVAWISVDEDIRFSREMNRTPPANQWIRSETEALSTDDVHPFPWGLLDVSFLVRDNGVALPQHAVQQAKDFHPLVGRDDLEDFVADLRGLSTLTEVPGFSLFAHGTAYFYTPRLQALQARMSGYEQAVHLIPLWLQYTTNAEFDDDASQVFDEATEGGKGKKADRTSVGQSRLGRNQGDSAERGQRAGSPGGLSRPRVCHRGSVIDVVHQGTSASLVHDLQASAQVSPPTSSGVDQLGNSHRPSVSESRHPSAPALSVLASAPSLPMPAPPLLEVSPFQSGARGLLTQPLLDDGDRMAGERQSASRGGAPTPSQSWLLTGARYWRRYCNCFSLSGSAGRRRRSMSCLFPWSQRSSARRIHPVGPRSMVAGGVTSGPSVRVEPKTFFANERTLLQWMNTAVLIATISITLMNFGNPVGRIAGLLMSPVAVFFIGYSFWVYLRRARALERKEPIAYNDKLGPSILVVTLMLSLSAVIALNLLYHEGEAQLPITPQNSSTSTAPSLPPSPHALPLLSQLNVSHSQAAYKAPSAPNATVNAGGYSVADVPAPDFSLSHPATAYAAATALAAAEAAAAAGPVSFAGAPERAVHAHVTEAMTHAASAETAAAEGARVTAGAK
ncbi:vacuolar transporter chaperone VTC2 [Toxoplasma gondii GAB2-2007-GAL-DOM2]|uniref:Vacuolar transporter chaperone VTC2 n=6 Tax=Toxoplasma gondii TaxID=5811 RepID=S7ULP3_TOXGG|nr:vacuolar transporter chaperone VTC2 [Toxoplasma gondii GT1]KAF4639909.1 vacuolar transporter chaperone VTC2 [Toxoplasma gondii]KFG30213.1 vacuolar transporter chaperone VTC2 [Toxoplasma gondii GAB2-2007-GAL-DOM2]KFG31912.1 vacuolar transporter chaperone VTC2 [Toxoplasma gondii FOU]PUA83357.1 vacuolar transporter chaperone VTC2 [Toxoplasma gondii TgCATBr9]